MSRFSVSEPEELLINGGNVEAPARVSARASIVETFKECGLTAALRVDREDLRRRILIPRRLRAAMAEAMRRKDAEAGVREAEEAAAAVVEAVSSGLGAWEDVAPEAPIVVFVNSLSGGRVGPIVKGRLIELIGNEQVFDLSEIKPSDFVQYGLACLEILSDHGDRCAKSTRENLRVMVAGGDGTVGWVLGSLGELHQKNREPMPPTGIIPLGTGNDLSRSFGWGGSFPFAWKSVLKRCLFKSATGQISHLDSWHVLISLPDGETIDLPHSLKLTEKGIFSQDGNIEGDSPDQVTCVEGVFYNYFSVGMDAQVAYGFHHFREAKPHLAQGPIANKLIYTGYSCAQGWFFTHCMSDPNLRGLNNILRLSVKKINSSVWEELKYASQCSVRAIVALNLHSYGSGRNPWGSPKPEYLLKVSFV
ncbi:Diacylglycerol kinase 4 [Apostasia shenzhenica]|uniref:Diacylglycerol kinase n=1 Tax=Apostasia shenzhenica TaxID=1088818 RepID=A0A2I0ABE0_9ASPA|nr:Diacylglycerol kinase 4 [Apostasia shenzhenica]